MMRVLFSFVLSLFFVPVFGQLYHSDAVRKVELPNKKTVNFGARLGFNSSMYLVSSFKIKDVTIDDIQNNYKIGGFAALFVRFNIEKHYIQPEISYQISRGEITFDKLGSQHPEIEPDYVSIRSDIYSLDAPVLYGYNIIKKGPYGLSVFGGPKIKYLWNKKNKITFENFDQNDIEEELYPLCFSAVIGVGVNISRIFFDFRYEQGLTNISKTVTYENMPVIKDETNHIIFRRREAILGFSLGILF